MTVRVIALVLLALIASGCAPVDAPSSIAVDVTQGRTDRDSRTIVLDVTNTGEQGIQLVTATLSTAQFDADAVWSRGTDLGPGRTVSLRAPLADPVCPSPANATPVVTVSYVDATGSPRTETITPTQSTDVLSIIERDDCIAVLAAGIAELRVSESVAWTPGAHQPAVLQVEVSPTGAGSLQLVEARSTILLQLVDSLGTRVEALPVGLSVDDGAGEQRITLDLVPTRCDPHAIAEDKRGTIMILQVRLDDATEGVVYVRSSDAVKAELFEFITDYCV